MAALLAALLAAFLVEAMAPLAEDMAPLAEALARFVNLPHPLVAEALARASRSFTVVAEETLLAVEDGSEAGGCELVSEAAVEDTGGLVV